MSAYKMLPDYLKPTVLSPTIKSAKVPCKPPPFPDIKNLYNNPEFADVTIIAGPDCKEIKVHKAIICQQSNFLKTACKLGFKDCAKPIINLPDVDINHFEIALKWIYTGNVDLDAISLVEEWIEIIQLGDDLMMPHFVEFCFYTLRTEEIRRLGQETLISALNILDMMYFALPGIYAVQMRSVTNAYAAYKIKLGGDLWRGLCDLLRKSTMKHLSEAKTGAVTEDGEISSRMEDQSLLVEQSSIDSTSDELADLEKALMVDIMQSIAELALPGHSSLEQKLATKN